MFHVDLGDRQIELFGISRAQWEKMNYGYNGNSARKYHKHDWLKGDHDGLLQILKKYVAIVN